MRFGLVACLLLSLSVLLSAGCATLPMRGDAQEKRSAIQQMKTETLNDLYARHPAAKGRVQRAAGYAVFSNVGVNFVYLSLGGGWGVAHDNRSGKEYFMRMVSGGLGLGLGVKDFRGIFVFKNPQAFSDFLEQGSMVGIEGDIAAKSGDKGSAAGGAVSVSPGVDLYQFTQNGLSVQATIQGSKYYVDEDLN